MDDLKKLSIEFAVDSATLATFSHDASFFEVTPSAVVFPKNSDEVKRLVTFVSEKKKAGENISLTARSGGTCMSGGPLSTSIVLDCKKNLNKVIEVGDGYAISEPGAYYRDFEKETLKKGMIMPSFPASREICAIGGMVSNNSGGEKTLTYGKTENYVEELKMVFADGNEYSVKKLSMPELEAKKAQNDFEGKLYRDMFSLIDSNYDLIQRSKPNVSKNSAGYFLWNVYDKAHGTFDLTRLIVGAQGTLGINTQVRFRLIKPKKYSELMVVFLKDMNVLGYLAKEILKFGPESFESYDDHTFKLAVKLFPQMAKQMKGNMISLGFAFLPEFWMVVSGGIPKLVLLAEFSGESQEEAGKKAEDARQAIKKFKSKAKIFKTEKEMSKYWTIRRESFNLLRKHVHGMRTAPFIDDFVVHPQDLSTFLPELYAILNRYDILYTIAGHVGDANFHIIPLMDLSRPDAKTIIENLSGEVYNLVFRYRGSMSGEHNDGLVRTPFLRQMYGKEVYRLFEKTKAIFDPLGIFNPGKKIGGDMGHALEYLVKK